MQKRARIKFVDDIEDLAGVMEEIRIEPQNLSKFGTWASISSSLVHVSNASNEVNSKPPIPCHWGNHLMYNVEELRAPCSLS